MARETTEREELGVDREALDAWEPPASPPPGFADGVVSALRDEPAEGRGAPVEPPSRSGTSLLVAAAVVATLVVGVVVALRLAGGGEGSAGRLEATRRESVPLGSRGVAVAEAGSRLSWEVSGSGHARLEQAAGNVFYRVDRGGPFLVSTPAGEVRVTGTSFRVEVVDMTASRQSLVAAAASAAVPTAVVVTVYEGRVVLAGEGGAETEIEPGERAWAAAGAAPSEALDVGGSLAADREALAATLAGAGAPAGAGAVDLRRRNAELLGALEDREEEISGLRAKVRELESGGEDDDGSRRRERYFPLTQEELDDLVEHCAIKLDLPPVSGVEAGRVGDHAEILGLDAAEVELLDEAIEELHGSFLARLRPIYVEATGDEEGARSLSPDAMLAEIQSKAVEGEPREAARRIAAERAGRAAPPESLEGASAIELALRLVSGLGDEFEATASERLGPARARAIREAGGGWPWGRSQSRFCRPGE